MEIHQIQAPVAAELAAVEALIKDNVQSKITLIGDVGKHIFASGGKRLRPLLHLLIAKALGYQGDQHLILATVLEFVHTATLLHDDVIDGSEMRRGKPSANTLWTNKTSVLVGDFLFSRAFQYSLETQNLAVLAIIADVLKALAQGEIMQLNQCNNPATTEQLYFDIIACKTATLFAAAGKLGALINDVDDATQRACHTFGLHLGNAFQLIDDKLDYDADTETLGKNLGDDLAEGKPTLPLIYAMQHGNPAQVKLIQTCIKQADNDPAHLSDVLTILEQTGALNYTADCANRETQAALAAITILPTSPYRDALIGLAEFSLHRHH